MKKKTKAQIWRDYNILCGILNTFLKDKESVMSAISRGQLKQDRRPQDMRNWIAAFLFGSIELVPVIHLSQARCFLRKARDW